MLKMKLRNVTVHSVRDQGVSWLWKTQKSYAWPGTRCRESCHTPPTKDALGTHPWALTVFLFHSSGQHFQIPSSSSSSFGVPPDWLSADDVVPTSWRMYHQLVSLLVFRPDFYGVSEVETALLVSIQLLPLLYFQLFPLEQFLPLRF